MAFSTYFQHRDVIISNLQDNTFEELLKALSQNWGVSGHR